MKTPLATPPERLDLLEVLLRDPATLHISAQGACDAVGLQPHELLEALIDLRHRYPDLISAAGFPRLSRVAFRRLLDQLSSHHPNAFQNVHPAVADRLEAGLFDPLLVAIAHIYGLDYRRKNGFKRREGQVLFNAERMRNEAITTLGRREDWRLLPTERYADFARLWTRAIEAEAMAWFERAFPPPLDPKAYIGRPTRERLEHYLKASNPLHYRHYLGKRPPGDLLEVATSGDFSREDLAALAAASLESSQRTWRRLGRSLSEHLEPHSGTNTG